MKRRTIKPDFFSDTKTGRMCPQTQVLFIGLLCLADKEGYIEYDCEYIRSQVFPYNTGKVDKNINELMESGLVIKCNYIGKDLLNVINFKKHQPIHPNEAKSPYPPIDCDDVIKCNYIKLHPNANGNGITNANLKKERCEKFTPPSLEEVSKYCSSRGDKVDPKQFYDYYSAGDWKDKDGNKVRSWKQKFITWESNQFKGGSASKSSDKKSYDEIKALNYKMINDWKPKGEGK